MTLTEMFVSSWIRGWWLLVMAFQWAAIALVFVELMEGSVRT